MSWVGIARETHSEVWSHSEKKGFAAQRQTLRQHFDDLTTREELLRQEVALKFVEAFNAIDHDESGSIDSEELMDVLQQIFPTYGTESLHSFRDLMMREADSNADGLLSLKEYLASDWAALLYDAGGILTAEAQRSKLVDAFREIDTDCSGTIECYELLHVLREVFPEVREEVRQHYYKQIVADCDANNDGVIDLEEFLNSSFAKVLSVRQRGSGDNEDDPFGSSGGGRVSCCSTTTSSSVVGPRQSRCEVTSPKLISTPYLPKVGRSYTFTSSDFGSLGVTVDDTTAIELLTRAEQLLQRPDDAVSFQWDEARQFFIAAAEKYVQENHWEMAGNAYVRASDCSAHLRNQLACSVQLVHAAECYKLLSSEDAIECLSQAVTIQVAHNHIGTAAVYEKDIAALYAQEGCIELALPHYKLAAKYYSNGNTSKLNALVCTKAIAELYIRLDQPLKAVPYLESLTTQQQSNTTFQMTIILFNAWLCLLLSNPITGLDYLQMLDVASKALQEYEMLCEGIRFGSSSPEARATQNITKALEKKDFEELQDATLLYREHKQRLSMKVDAITSILLTQLLSSIKAYIKRFDEELQRQIDSVTARLRTAWTPNPTIDTLTNICDQA